jgi:hypothetical protein
MKGSITRYQQNCHTSVLVTIRGRATRDEALATATYSICPTRRCQPLRRLPLHVEEEPIPSGKEAVSKESVSLCDPDFQTAFR